MPETGVSVPFHDFRRLPPALRQRLATAAAEVIDSGWYVLGPRVAAFEKLWAEYCGLPHAIGVGNGMDAIEIGLRCLDLHAGDEVITTPLTAFASVLGILRAGAVPVLADIDAATGLLSPESVARTISPRTRAVLLVHLYGQVRAMDRWRSLCATHGLRLLEDAAQAHGAKWEGGQPGAFGDWAAYSFYPTKNLGAFGDAGALVTRDPALAARAASLRNYGQSDRYHHPMTGLNSRLDELQAALLQTTLPHLSEWTQRRRHIAERLRREIRTDGRVGLLAAPESPGAHVHHLFVVTCPERAALQQHLQARGVQSLIHYPVCVHEQPPCAGLRHDPAGLAQAERFARTCLSLPCHPFVTEEEISQVIAAVNAF